MKPASFLAEACAFLFLIIVINAFALPSVVLHHRGDASLTESLGTVDELRYMAKIREAAEGRWLMSNPILKEYHGTAFSPSGFVEWIPALFIRALDWNVGLMLFLTDLLCTGVVVLLARLWLRRLIPNRIAVWAVLFILFTTGYGGALNGLLRDSSPKFTQPFFSLYLLLLTLPSRGTWERTMLRSSLIGVMFYTYPYHWTIALASETVYFAYRVVLSSVSWTPASLAKNALRLWSHAAAAFVPFAVIAAPLMVAMRSMLARPEFSDFYARYHIAYSHIPAAPRLQIIVLAAIAVIGMGLWLERRYRSGTVVTIEYYLPLLLPLSAMFLLLNTNVLTGKDPEWLGHGGSVIFPVVFVAYAAVIVRMLPRRFLLPMASVACVLAITVAASEGRVHWNREQASYTAWTNSDEKKVIDWLAANLPSERVIAAPRVLAERIPALTSHYVYFSAAAHFFFVPTDELAERYLGWVGLFPGEQEPTEIGTMSIFGNYPGAQWSKERTWNRLLGRPFTKTIADYIPRQDLREQIDREHASVDPTLTAQRIKKYNTEVIVTTSKPAVAVTVGMSLRDTVGSYQIWVKQGL